MKNIFSKCIAVMLILIFAFALTACESKEQPSVPPNNQEEEQPLIYSHVAIIGVDGGGIFFNQTDTPNMDKIFAKGATTYTATAEIPTISAQNWGAILHGVACDVHGLTNDMAEEGTIDSSFPYPSIFRAIRQSDADAVLCSAVNWGPINHGLIESDLGVVDYRFEDDEKVAENAANFVLSSTPTLLFVQFDGADGEGHSNGYGSKDQLEYITVLDGYIRKIYDAYDDMGILDETLFIVTSDHGGTYYVDENGESSGSHGGSTPEEYTVFIGITGKSVANIDLGTIRNRDLAAIAAAALNIDKPEVWTSEVPEGLFTDR